MINDEPCTSCDVYRKLKNKEEMNEDRCRNSRGLY